MNLQDVALRRLDGEATSLDEYRGKAALIVNVASRCGLTPQYSGLERLQERYGDQGFVVLGFPCNQFMGQEPGTPEEIATFCSTTYGVTFPLFEKIDVNGDDRHPLYQQLTTVPVAMGVAGVVLWILEIFVVAPGG
jgi:glutathione peroxidase